MKTRTVCLTLCLLWVSLTTMAQAAKGNSFSGSETFFDRNFQLENDSKTEEITINVQPKTQLFNLRVNSSISGGKLTIELYDPNGTKQGNYTVGIQASSQKKEKTDGRFIKKLNEPQSGDWKIKMIPAEATGRILMEVNLIEKP